MYWNSEVEKQSRTETDSNKRIYYKLPSQLEHHQKKTLTWKFECSTMFLGGNAVALLDVAAFDAQGNPQPTSERPAFQLPRPTQTLFPLNAIHRRHHSWPVLSSTITIHHKKINKLYLPHTNNLYFHFLICDSFILTCSKPRKMRYAMCTMHKGFVQKAACMRGPNSSRELQLRPSSVAKG